MGIFLIGLFYSLSGFLMKLSDDIFDESNFKHFKTLSIIIAIISGLLMGYLTVISVDASYIFLTILLSNLIALKVDGIHHISSMIAFILIAILLSYLLYGFNFNIIFSTFSFLTLAICIIASYIDEWGNDNEKLYEKSGFFKVFFDHRCGMKIAILILAILGYLQGIYGFSIPYLSFLSLETFIFFMLFDIFYEIAGFVFNKYLN